MPPFLQPHENLCSLPNCVTYSRLVLLPLLLYAMALDWQWTVFLLFIGMAISDYYDGYLARILAIKSTYGAWLDQLADKIFVLSIMVMLLFLGQIAVWAYPAAALIFARELIVGIQRWHPTMISSKPVGMMGKIKTTVQMLALLLLLLPDILFGAAPWMVFSAQIMLWLSALLALSSMLGYLRQAKQAKS